MSDINVRKGRLSDKEFIIEAQIAMALETEELQLDREVLESGVQAVFDDPKKGEYFIAELDSTPVGCLLTLTEWSDWRNGNVLWIHSVFVRPESRGKGIYKKMYEHLKKTVTESDLRGLRLYVEKTNHRAQQVYKKLGMSDEHYALFEWLK